MQRQKQRRPPRTLSTPGGLKSLGITRSPAARWYRLTARLWSTLLVPGIYVHTTMLSLVLFEGGRRRREEGKSKAETGRNTHHLPLIKLMLPLPLIPLKAGTHIHTRAHHVDSVLEPLGDERVVHLACCYGLEAGVFAGGDEL